MSIRVRPEITLNKIFRLHDDLMELPIEEYHFTFDEVYLLKDPLPIHEIYEESDDPLFRDIHNNLVTDTLPYHEKRDDIFRKIDSLYRELTPDYGQLFLATICQHRSAEEIRLMDEAYRKTTPHEGKKLLAKMCPPNV